MLDNGRLNMFRRNCQLRTVLSIDNLCLKSAFVGEAQAHWILQHWPVIAELCGFHRGAAPKSQSLLLERRPGLVFE